MNRFQNAGMMALCAAIVGGGTAGAQSVNPFANFVQIRGLYPFENGNFSSAPALDAALQFPIGAGVFSVKLEALTVIRQRGQIDLRFEQAFAGLSLNNEPGVSGRDLSLAGLMLYEAPEANIAALRGATLAYSLEANTGGSTGYEYHTGEVGFRGDLAERWNWSLDYALSSDLNPVRSRVVHSADTWLRTDILEPFTLGVGLGLRARDGRVIYQGSLEGAINLTDRDALGVRLTLTTAPGDEERLFYNTSRLEPVNLNLYLGRSRESALIWGATLSANTEFGVQLQAQYDARVFGTTSHEFSLGVRYGGFNGNLSLRGGFNAEFDATQGVWFGRLVGQLTANLNLEPVVFSATARVDAGPDRLTGSLESNLTFYSFPWLVLLEADLKFRQTIVGALTAQSMYFFLPNIALNLTGVYRWQPTGSSGFSFGAGLRYAF